MTSTQDEAAPQPTDEQADSEPLRVVIADDDPIMVELIAGWLRDAAFEVIECVDGASALNACVANQPDLAIIDYEMPGYGGGELASFIVSQTASPLIFISVHEERSIIDSAIDAGASAYLVKPVEQSQFMATVRAALERGREMRELRSQTDKLHRALEAGRAVNLATGFLMGRFGITQRDAFERLRRHARSNRSRLEDVAAQLLRVNEEAAQLLSVFSRELPAADSAPRRR